MRCSATPANRRRGAGACQRVALAEPEEQRADLARDLGVDDREQRRPAAARALAPDRDDEPPARPQHAPHLAQRLFRVGHVHQSERAQRDVEARVGQRERFGIHARERRVRHAVLPRALARGVDHAARQIDAEHLAGRRRPHVRRRTRPARSRTRRRARARRRAAPPQRAARSARRRAGPAKAPRSRRRRGPSRSAGRGAAIGRPCPACARLQRRVTTISRYSLGTTSESRAGAVQPVQQLGQVLLERCRAFRRQCGERLVHRPVPGAEHLDEVRRRAIAEVEHPRRDRDRRGALAEQLLAGAPRCPTATAAARRPAAARGLPSTLNSWPMKPSGVQFARPMRPPGRHTRASSAADFAWSGANITPKVDSTASKLASSNGSASASAAWNLTSRPSARARSAPRSSRLAT